VPSGLRVFRVGGGEMEMLIKRENRPAISTNLGLLVLLAGSVLSACNRDGALASRLPVSAGLQRLDSGGVTREYLLHISSTYDAGTAVPLLINIHGFSATAQQQALLSGMSGKSDNEGFIVVYPQALGDPPTWRVGPLGGGDEDLAFIVDLIDHMQAGYNIDPRRIYATGISNGGGMVNRLGCELADRVAAIGPVSGAYLFDEDCSPARPVPVVAFHGTADQLVPYEGKGISLPPIEVWAGDWARRNGCSAESTVSYQQGEVSGQTWGACRDQADVVLYTIQDGGHTWPGVGALPGLEGATKDIIATDVMWVFFMDHPKP